MNWQTPHSPGVALTMLWCVIVQQTYDLLCMNNIICRQHLSCLCSIDYSRIHRQSRQLYVSVMVISNIQNIQKRKIYIHKKKVCRYIIINLTLSYNWLLVINNQFATTKYPICPKTWNIVNASYFNPTIHILNL